MALTVVYPNVSAFDLSGTWGAQKIVYAKITGDTSYPQGAGYAVTPGTFGLATAILGIFPVNPSVQNYFPWYDPSNKSLRLIIAGNTTLSEVATATNLSGVSLDIGVAGY